MAGMFLFDPLKQGREVTHGWLRWREIVPTQSRRFLASNA